MKTIANRPSMRFVSMINLTWRSAAVSLSYIPALFPQDRAAAEVRAFRADLVAPACEGRGLLFWSVSSVFAPELPPHPVRPYRIEPAPSLEQPRNSSGPVIAFS